MTTITQLSIKDSMMVSISQDYIFYLICSISQKQTFLHHKSSNHSLKIFILFYLGGLLQVNHQIQQIISFSYCSYFLLKSFKSIQYIILFTFNTFFILYFDFGVLCSGYLSAITCITFMKIYSLNNNNNHNSKLTLNQFHQYIYGPNLIYKPTNPKQIIRYKYAVKKLFNVIYFTTLLLVLIVHYIEPLLIDKQNLFRQLFHIMFPINIFWIVLFFLVFENLCNLLGELTQTEDRQFYFDWWNSTTFEEFNYKWNRPVYQFLHTQVYSSIQKKVPNKMQAKILTFLVSAILHEYIMTLCLRNFNPMMVGIMMAQIPVIFLTKSLKKLRFGNMYFWFSMIHGIPLIISHYYQSV